VKRVGWPSALVLIVSATLAPGFSMSHVFFYRDLTIYFYPMQRTALNMLLRGEIPLWFPYGGFGTPFAAMADVLIYYPVSWLSWLLPQPFGFNFALMFHVYLAALATYWLARDLEMSEPAAFTASVTYALSGPFLSTVSMTNVLVAVSWLPVCLLATRWAARQPTAWRIMVLGAAFALQAIGGEPVFNFATALLAIPLCGARLPRFLRVLVPGAAFGVALIAVQLIPGVELLGKSIRHSSHFTFLEASQWSLHPLNLLELLVPDVMVLNSNDAFRWFIYSVGQPYLVNLYLGLLPLGLAAWALTRGAKREVAWIGAMLAGFLLLSFGSHSALYTLFYKLVPFVGTSRYPSKLMVIVAFCVALLAAWGIDALRDARAPSWRWTVWPAAIAVGIAIRAVTCDDLYRDWITESLRTMFHPEVLAIHGAKLAAMALLLALAFALSKRRPSTMIAMVVVCLTLDLAGTGHWVNPIAPKDIFTRPSPLLKLIGNGSPDFRIAGDAVAPRPRFPIIEDWSPEALAFLDGRLAMTQGDALDGVRDARDVSPNALFTPEYLDLRQRAGAFVRSHEHADLGRFNIRYFITNPRVGNETVPAGLHEVGRANTISRKLIVWEIEGWRPRVEVLNTVGSTARVTHETNSTVEVATGSPAAGTLLLRESFDSAWRARVDGVLTPITVSPDNFRLVPVPAGKHTVEFRYRPLSFQVGFAITLAALGAFLLVAFKAARS
jgi:hypothetical protein